VWRASRAAVKRRRLQTLVIGFVVLLSTATIVLGLGLVTASSGPFDQAFAAQRGAHVAASFERARVTEAQLAQTATRPGVERAAGPFATVQAGLRMVGAGDLPPIQTSLVGRADPLGPVDRLDLYAGRWVAGPGEVVMDLAPGDTGVDVGETLDFDGGVTLKVVGLATSVTRTADGWVSPEQIAALNPTGFQMLYRFTTAPRDAAASAADLSAATRGLPAGALTGSHSSVLDQQNAAAGPETYAVFLMVFGILSLAVAILIVGNVVSGTVVAGWRHIGVLKAIGFTPRQVVAVYLVMMSIPALVGSVFGVALGDLLAQPMLRNAFEHYGSAGVGVKPWVLVAALVGMPLLVALAALVPALRAGRLAAVDALSAGSASQRGRGLRAQRWLTGTRLPRSVSLGIGLPFARPARSVMTLAAVVLGVTTVTFATGLSSSLDEFTKMADRSATVQAEVFASEPGRALPVSSRTPEQITTLLSGLPGVAKVVPLGVTDVQLAGATQADFVTFYPTDGTDLGFVPLEGHWLNGPHQIAGTYGFLHKRGLHVGDTVTLAGGGRHATATIVGEVAGKGTQYWSDWDTLGLLDPDPHAVGWEVKLAPGTGFGAFQQAVAQADPGLHAGQTAGSGGSFVILLKSFAGLLTVMLSVVAALGVFNTVVLNTRERRRDLGMLKSIGMTPRQVTVMVVTSMAGLGVVGGFLGIPLGVGAHRVVMPLMAKTASVAFPDSVLHVFDSATLALFVVAGVGIAVVGALAPARAAARLTIAEVLHSE
jgi:putative ABC transport system permease protein